MKKVNIIKNNEVVQFALFEDDQMMNEFIQILAVTHSWGKPAYDEVVSQEQRIEHEDGSVEVIPAVIVSHDAEYYVEMVDVTDELQRQKESFEAKAYLLATDYKVIKAMETGIELDAGVKALRAAARLKVI